MIMALGTGSAGRKWPSDKFRDNQAPWLPGSNCRPIPWRPRVPFRLPRRFPRAAPWGSRGNGARPITRRGTITVTSAMLALHAFAAKGTGARSIAARG